MKQTLYLILLGIGMIAGCSDQTEAPPAKAPTLQESQPPVIEAPEEEIVKVAKYQGSAQVGKLFAKEECASCHGMNGMKSKYGTPFIAGQDEEYIVDAMNTYANGSRHNSAMKALVEKLDSQTIADIAAYYAKQKARWKGENIGLSPAKLDVSYRPGDIRTGAAIGKRCNSCHGDAGNSIGRLDSPSLAAMPPEYFIHSLNTYFNGKRYHKVMQVFGSSKSLNETEIKQLAAYYAVQTPVKPPKPKLGDPQKGRSLAATDCGGCHGIDGNASNPMIPSISGQPEDYLILSMKDYRDKRRDDPIMTLALHNYSDAMIADMAAYYAIQQPLARVTEKRDMESLDYPPMDEAIRIAKSCDACHGLNGNSTDPGTPSLTGLTARYLASATIAYRDDQWKHGAMKEMTYYLTDEQIEKVGLFYAQQEPKLKKKPKKFDKAAGEQISAACEMCHSDEAIKNNPRVPSLYGQDMQYLIAATKAYKNDARTNSSEMSLVAEAISAQAPTNLINAAGYYASRKANKPPQIIPQPPIITIVKVCGGCHGDKGQGTAPGIPKLAGQSQGYLINVMKEYRDDKRHHQGMNEIGDHLTLMEIKDIAAYYAKQ